MRVPPPPFCSTTGRSLLPRNGGRSRIGVEQRNFGNRIAGMLAVYVRREGKNRDSVMTAFGPSASHQLPCFSFTGNLVHGWNLLSLPFLPSSNQRSALFPSSVSSAFRYDKGYVRTDTLEPGVGYWLKFGADDSAQFSGAPQTIDSVDLFAGWNMIGAISYP